MTTLLVVLTLVTSVMVVVNLLTNLWARQHYLVISLWATGVLLAIAWLAGITWTELGLGFGGHAQTKGLIWSAALIGIGVGAILQVVVQLVPAMKDGAGKILTPVTSAAIGAGALALYLTGLLVTV